MIEVTHVSKWLGQRKILKDISFRVEKGEILGFLGPNGAGKTTTMRVLTGFFPPNEGSVKILGHDIVQNPLAVKQRLGYLPEHNPLYPEMTVEGYLRFAARIKGVEAKEETKRVNTVIAECGLEDVRYRLIRRLSKGYKQRIGLAQALVNDPEVLILDEPTIGLDPKQIYEIRQLIKSLAGKKTVILSTHILPEVSMVCTKVLIINRGQVVAEDTPAHLMAREGQVEILVKAPIQTLKQHLETVPEIKEIKIQPESEYVRAVIRSSPGLDIRSLLAREIVQQGWDLLELTPKRASLEEVFVQLVTEEAS
ncbi:MAG: ATP-binding cassette domain-containing protein [Candidatus Desulfofervidaceae bacterium]|nr:ATP-binding cassette domain-containing protein [Candidatus Desulfofervidaceae bacterium]MDL1971135.1 ABC transporter ATP-binding protein [Candidatus Desulfofervidaceae bacterium]